VNGTDEFSMEYVRGLSIGARIFPPDIDWVEHWTNHTTLTKRNKFHEKIFCSPSPFYIIVHSRCRGFFKFHLITLKHTPQSLGFLWTRDRPVAETSTWHHKHCTRDKHPYPRWDSNPRSQQALGRRPRGHWDRLHDKLREKIQEIMLHVALHTVNQA
jgi:hypothetical protein